MSVEVGVDSYAGLEAANEYIELHYSSKDERKGAWDALSEADREVFLRRAAMNVDSAKYAGVKARPGQPLAFPRRFGEGADGDTPAAIVAAQIEECFEIACPSNDSIAFEARTSGVKAYSIGRLSETFESPAEGGVGAVLVSRRARELIAPYMGGGFNVR